VQIIFQSLDYPEEFADRFAHYFRLAPEVAKTASARLFGYASWQALVCDGVGSGRMPSRPDWMVCEQVAKTRWFVLSDRLQSVLEDMEMDDEVSIELSLMQLQPTARLPAQPIHFQALTEIFPVRWSLSVKRDSPGFASSIPRGFKLKIGSDRAEEMRGIVNEYLGAQQQRESQLSNERGYRILVGEFPDSETDGAATVFLIVRLMPMIVDGIVIGVELCMDSHSYQNAPISPRQAEVMADGLCAYLSYAKLWEGAVGYYSGAADGVFLTVLGEAHQPDLVRIAEALSQRLAHCQRQFLDDGICCGPDGAYRGSLPIRTLDYLVDTGPRGDGYHDNPRFPAND